jgi:hypothetical protein
MVTKWACSLSTVLWTIFFFSHASFTWSSWVTFHSLLLWCKYLEVKPWHRLTDGQRWSSMLMLKPFSFFSSYFIGLLLIPCYSCSSSGQQTWSMQYVITTLDAALESHPVPAHVSHFFSRRVSLGPYYTHTSASLRKIDESVPLYFLFAHFPTTRNICRSPKLFNTNSFATVEGSCNY